MTAASQPIKRSIYSSIELVTLAESSKGTRKTNPISNPPNQTSSKAVVTFA
jgi:hypothetical protein